MLLIYLPVISPRSEYIFDFVFKKELGLEYRVTASLQDFEAHQEEKINYSPSRNTDELFIMASSFLFENSVKETYVAVEEKYQVKVLFPNASSCDLGFDIFSAIFYMVSRYEEYLPFTPDSHGRFKATDSFAHKNNFLHLPVVNTWMDLFKDFLQKKFPAIQCQPSYFKAIVTYDIDVAYKFKGRGFKRTVGATVADLVKINFKNIYGRLQTLANKHKDPWDLYDYLQGTIVQNNLDAIFFFLLSDGSPHDRNLDYNNPAVRELVDRIKTFSEIGIHPSYTTYLFPEKIEQEKGRLEKLSGKPVQKSRQHYLKFKLPATYNDLITAGITEDYSMGFSGLPGFRAGTCKPFYFYDLEKERSTALKIFPITFMEGAFMDYQVISPSQASQEIRKLIEAVKNVKGTFISIWHNHTVSETDGFVGWKKVHDDMIGVITRILKNDPLAIGLHEGGLNTIR